MSRYSAQQSSISENNRSRILQYLYHNGICSRAQIAKAIKLTPAAITKITAKLLAQGIIEETGDMDGDKNRRSIGLNLNCAKYHIIGVKFARSLVQIAVFDLKCNRIFLSDLPTVSEEHIPETVERIRDTVRQLIKDDPSIVAVGMAVPGPYLKDEGRTALVSSMQGWRQINFIDEFSNAFSSPCSSNRRPRRRAGAVPAQSGTVGRFPRLLSAWRRHRPRSHRQRHHLLRRARHRHGNRTRLHRRERQAMRLRQCRMPGTLLLRQRHPRTTQRQPEHRSRMRDDDACAGLRSTVRQGERGRRDRDASDARCCPIRWVRRGHHHQRFQSDTHRSWRHHRASRPAVARRSHTSRARTHDPRNRAQHPNHPVRPAHRRHRYRCRRRGHHQFGHPSMFFDVA